MLCPTIAAVLLIGVVVTDRLDAQFGAKRL